MNKKRNFTLLKSLKTKSLDGLAFDELLMKKIFAE